MKNNLEHNFSETTKKLLSLSSHLYYPILSLIVIVPFLAATVPFLLVGQNSIIVKFLSVFLSILLYLFSYIFVCGFFARAFSKFIVTGKWSRNPRYYLYAPRKIYGLCWTAVYYFKPLYWFILYTPFLQKVVFRLFGYKGDTNFTVYPDCWIRDLPLLHIDKHAYLSNRATIATNICIHDGTPKGQIIIGEVSIGEKTVIGHLTIICLNTYIDNDCEIGMGAFIGLGVTIGQKTKIGPRAYINHGATIESNVIIGANSFIGKKAHIKSGIVLPIGTTIPPNCIVSDQDQINDFILPGSEKITSSNTTISN